MNAALHHGFRIAAARRRRLDSPARRASPGVQFVLDLVRAAMEGREFHTRPVGRDGLQAALERTKAALEAWAWFLAVPSPMLAAEENPAHPFCEPCRILRAAIAACQSPWAGLVPEGQAVTLAGVQRLLAECAGITLRYTSAAAERVSFRDFVAEVLLDRRGSPAPRSPAALPDPPASFEAAN